MSLLFKFFSCTISSPFWNILIGLNESRNVIVFFIRMSWTTTFAVSHSEVHGKKKVIWNRATDLDNLRSVPWSLFFSWWATVVANGDRLTASPQPIRCLQPKKNDRYASSKPELSRLQQETRRSTKHFWRDRLTAFVDRHRAWFMCFRFISCSSCMLRPCLDPNFFQKSLSHQKKFYYFIVLNKICL